MLLIVNSCTIKVKYNVKMQLFKLLHSIVHVQMIGANIVWFHERSLITMPFLHSIIKQSVHGNS